RQGRRKREDLIGIPPHHGVALAGQVFEPFATPPHSSSVTPSHPAPRAALPRQWNRMQRCGIGGEGETGAFKCLTLSTLSPAPDAGPFFESRSAHYRAGLSPTAKYQAQNRKQGSPRILKTKSRR